MSTTLVLVHGAWHGAWCWSAFEPELRARGLDVVTLDLTSRGTDPATVGDLRSDAELLRATVSEIPGPVVLLGHSYGGVVVTEAAADLDNVTQLVYLAAFLPDVGDSMRTLTGGGNAPWLSNVDGLLSVAPGWGSRLFYSDCDPEVAAGAEAQLSPQSAASFGQEVRVASWKVKPSQYIVCGQDRAVPVVSQRRWAGLIGDGVELNTGHSPFLSEPKKLADLIVERI
ncbi:alpha/beta hydrolase [Actinokineospora enzanensis]|uniref:alpha/beta hydrolase n=1 Tax=Actinokineospora enzanensis TaxID=155975 RepID=UPI00037B47CF|nr:alpha/beta hydrolase [Actinokineospora enzanensis]